MPFQRGRSGNPQGRPSGIANKLTRNIREDILETFDSMGGREKVLEWALKNPGDFYVKLFGRLIPPGGGVWGDVDEIEAVTVNVVHGPGPEVLKQRIIHALKDYMTPDEAVQIAQEVTAK